MKDNSNSGFGNRAKDLANEQRRHREGKVTSVALKEAVEWTEKMYLKEHRGRGDKGLRVLKELSENTGVPERYLYRLLYQSKGMKDVAGEAYRLLNIAKARYENWCENNEAAAERMRTQRLELRNPHEVNPEPAVQSERMDSPGN
jgi:hypothetical protein